MNAVTTTDSFAVKPTGGFDLSPQTFEQAMKFSHMLAESDFVPKDFKGKPGNCLIAMQWGSEIGLKPLQALQNLAVINGRPALWGDSVIAIVRSSPLCEYVTETDDGKTATCTVKRRGEPPQTRVFSMDDASKAGLLGKQGPWTQYPKRMRQMRARAFALRDVFPDVLRGMPVAEEIMDAPRDMGTVEGMHGAEAKPETKLPEYPQEALERNLPAWRAAIASGKKTAEQIISMVSSKGVLSEEQKRSIQNLTPIDAGSQDAPMGEPDADGVLDV
jgi:hypothetical protein